MKATNAPWMRAGERVAASSAITTASSNGTEPASCSAASTQALNAITDATERSISPLMITNAITTTTISFSIESWNMFTKFCSPR